MHQQGIQEKRNQEKRELPLPIRRVPQEIGYLVFHQHLDEQCIGRHDDEHGQQHVSRKPEVGISFTTIPIPIPIQLRDEQGIPKQYQAIGHHYEYIIPG